jgi:hypothetical protein
MEVQMTKNDILTATPEWLNEYTCLKMGMVPGLPETADWNPAEDIRDAYQLEEKIKEMGIQGKYCDKLDTICCQMEGLKFDFWNCIHATPEQRCKAFLLAQLEPGN